MNIAYFSHYFMPEIGAPSARIYDLSQQWLRLGHRVQVVTCFPNHPSGQIYPGYRRQRYLCEDLDGITTHRNWTYITPNKGFARKTIGHLSFIVGSKFSAAHLESCDVVIGTSPTFFAATAAASFARRRKLPFIMEVRDLWPAIFVELGVLRNRQVISALEAWEKRLYRQAARVVVVTDAFRRNLIQRGVPADKVVMIPNGADIDYWRPQNNSSELRQKLGLRDRFAVLYLGAHGVSQALGRVLDAAAELQEIPEVQFVLVGDGAEKEKLQRQAGQAQLTNVRFVDAVDKKSVADYYDLADACLVPLRNIPLFETFIPSKMFEIMAMARPIIASVRGEAAEILRRSGAATVVEPENSHQLAEAILELYRLSPAARNEMGQRGRSFVNEHYSRAALAKPYADLLQQAISESS